MKKIRLEFPDCIERDYSTPLKDKDWNEWIDMKDSDSIPESEVENSC